MKTAINFFGCPGSYKSTYAASLFGDMKRLKYDVELIPEYAKQLTWEKRTKTLENQVAVFGRQYEAMCIPDTQYIVTDSPLILTLLYNKGWLVLNQLALNCHTEFKNINFLLKLKDYDPKGRNQTLFEALELQTKLIYILNSNNIPYLELEHYNFEMIKNFL